MDIDMPKSGRKEKALEGCLVPAARPVFTKNRSFRNVFAAINPCLTNFTTSRPSTKIYRVRNKHVNLMDIDMPKSG
jgi:hypothetical protein